MTRRIVQIAGGMAIGGRSEWGVQVLFALCDDGTLWKYLDGDGFPSSWEFVPNVPQPAQEPRIPDPVRLWPVENEE